jgi:hypothetical protein
MSIARAARLGGAVKDQDSESYQEGRRDGMVWASEYATADELHGLVEDFELGRSCDFDASHSLYNFMNGKQHADATSVPHYGNPFWRGFAAGAEEVLDEVSSSC